MDAASQCMLIASTGCASDVVLAWETAFHAAIGASTSGGLIADCTNVCATDPCHNSGICSPAANDDGFTCLCPPTHLPPYCIGGIFT